MCSLCGSLLRNRHWSEKTKSSYAEKAERRLQLQLINQVLDYYDANVRKLGNYGYLLTVSNRSSRLVEDLARLWLELETLTGLKCDPLDPSLIAAISK